MRQWDVTGFAWLNTERDPDKINNHLIKTGGFGIHRYPAALFDRVFGTLVEPDAAADLREKRKSVLDLVSTELKPFAWRTGVSQLYGLARSLHESGEWQRVTAVMPWYPGIGHTQPPRSIETFGPGDLRCLLVRNAGIERHGTQVFDRQLVGGLPHDTKTWESFADDVAALILAEHDPRCGFEAMGFDWASGPTLRRLSQIACASCLRRLAMEMRITSSSVRAPCGALDFRCAPIRCRVRPAWVVTSSSSGGLEKRTSSFCSSMSRSSSNTPSNWGASKWLCGTWRAVSTYGS